MDVDVTQLAQFIAWDRVPFAILVLVIGAIVQIFVTRFIDDLGERFSDRRLFFKKVGALTRFAFIGILAAFTASTVLVFRADTLVAVVGSLGFVFGLGFKDIVSSLIAGVIILWDEPFQVGDRVAYGDYYGEIQAIGIRSVRLVTLDDNLVTIPNNLFLNEAVASANAGAFDCMVVMKFFIGAAEDFHRARRIVTEATATSRYVYLDKPLVTLLSDEFMGERFITVIKVKAYVFDARYEKSFASDVTERVKRAFRHAGIRTPDQQYRDLDIYGREEPGEI